MSDCLVSASDYQRFWTGAESTPGDHVAAAWNGRERRRDVPDRRTRAHERRWEASKGRRWRLADRRTDVAMETLTQVLG